MKKLREGWHIVAGYRVYVDSDGMIRHGTKRTITALQFPLIHTTGAINITAGTMHLVRRPSCTMATGA